MVRQFLLHLSVLAFASGAHASGAAISYQGRIIQPDGSALNTGNVQFRIQIRTPDSSNCLMYEENRTVPMTGSNGVFALSLNGTGAARTDAAIYDFNRIFANKGTFTFPTGDCGTTNTYTPSGSAGRKVTAMFYANGAWEALPSMNVNFVPYAVESTTVGGYGSGDLLRVDHLTSEVVAPFTFADYGKLVDLAAGKLNGSVLPTLSSGQVLGSDGSGNWTAVTPLTAAGLPGCATGEYLRVSSGALVCQAVAISGGTVTSITAGAGLTGGTITSSGTIALTTVGSGGTGTKLTYDTYGRVTASASLAESDIPTLTAAGRVNGSAISGTISNGTVISTSGAIQTSTDLMAGRFYLYDGGGSNTIGFRAPATVVPYVLTYPAAQGAAGQTLVNNGLGQLAWTTPLASVSGSASLANGKIWVGDGSGKAQEVSVSGDASISGSGALTLSTVPVAKGGTGLTAAPTNGQLLIGNGTGYALGTITGGSGVNVANSAGGITITATGSGGTVTNVTGSAPIAVATGSSTPAISIAKATSSVDGYLAATDFATFNAKLGTASTFAGDVSGTSSTMSVDKLKATPLLITTLTTGQYLKYNGTNWINAVIDAADIGIGTLPAARMPAHTGDVTSSAGSTTLTLATVTPAKGGTGLTSIGTANQILGVNTGATGLEYKSLTAGSGVSITPSAGSLTITATGSGGTVTNVTGTAPIVVATGTTTPAVSIAKSTAAVDGYLAATDFATFNAKLGTTSTFAGDVSGTSSSMSVDKLKATLLSITALTTGQYLKYNGTNWINVVIDAADIGTGTLPAARMPAHTGDVTSSAGSTTLTLATVTPAKGGTGLTSIGTANQILGVNTGATGLEYKTLTAGTGVTITPAAGTLTINATGSGGTVTNVTSANSDISIATGSSTPLLTLNSGTGANQILKLEGTSKIPTVDGSQLTNLNPTSLSATIPVTKGGTGAATLTARGVLLGQGTSAVTSTVGGAGTLLQGNGAAADPTFTASPVIGINATATGSLGLANGAASGTTTTIKPSAAATTAYNFTLPPNGGTNGYVLQTDGSGTTSWTAAAASGTVNTGSINQLAYYAGAGNVLIGLGSAASSVLMTNGSGVPAWSPLSNDAFVQYALLAGRSGGQTFKGGTGASENLTLDSTANATKGSVLIAPTSGPVGVGTTTPVVKLDVAGEIRVGNAGTLCNNTTEGAFRYNSALKKLEFCDATSWRGISTSAIVTLLIGSPSVSIVKAGPVTFPITYGSGTDTATISLVPANVSIGGTGAVGCSVSSVTGSGSTRTVTVNGCTGTGTVNISIAAGTANSTTGDAAPGAGPSTAYNDDNTGPTAPTAVMLGAVPNDFATSPPISYTPGTDVGGSTVANHQVQILLTSNSSVVYPWMNHSSGTAVSGLTLANSTQYTVLVREVDALGNAGTASSPVNWTTVSSIYPFLSQTFTTCGIYGQTGPLQTDCVSSYSASTWTANSSYFSVTGGIQKWTVPLTATYRITVTGAGGLTASGAGAGGGGAKISAEFTLTQSDQINIVVGQRTAPSSSYGSGGGGSFVWRDSAGRSVNPLMAAGGGGGGGNSGVGYPAYAASFTTTATGPSGGGAGSAGNGASTDGNTSGGMGWFTNGSAPNGGISSTFAGGSGPNVVGGFGGGGGVSYGYGQGGGGGGYSGGGAGPYGNRSGGGGGASFINPSGANPQNINLTNTGDGSVLIEKL